MKKFSTAASLLVFATLLSPVMAFASEDNPVQTHCQFRADAPDQHVVVKGDTLWAISGQFLEHPWCWPQVWDLNREEIRHPHWIYPGQIVYFDRAAGRLRLGTPVAGSPQSPNGTLKLSPQIRSQTLGADAITSVDPNAIEPFLSQPLIVDEKGLDSAPRIVASEEGRVVMARDQHAYVNGELGGGTAFQVFHPGQPLKDPDTGKVIAYEAVYTGNVKLQRAAQAPNEAHRFIVTSSKEEIQVGDRLVPVPPTSIMNYAPHLPAQEVRARVVSIYGGVSVAGQSQIISINRGAKHGVDVGTVLELYTMGRTVKDPLTRKDVKIPDEQYGTLFIFRVFDGISYGLIMQVRDTVRVGDVVRSPEQ